MTIDFKELECLIDIEDMLYRKLMNEESEETYREEFDDYGEEHAKQVKKWYEFYDIVDRLMNDKIKLKKQLEESERDNERNN